MSLPKSPRAAANAVSLVLSKVLGADRFPIDVEAVALEMSRQWCPRSPITKVEGHRDLGRFEGALQQHPQGKYWRIKFNADRRPSARFTIAHGSVITRCRGCERPSSAASRTFRAQRSTSGTMPTPTSASALIPLDDLRRQIDG
ncbi:MAG: hypothetical protein IPK27_17835 [Rhodanobacteraceae bacterium]|nr:hypothetical protein [Rhodanobacteraceae bacterium]